MTAGTLDRTLPHPALATTTGPRPTCEIVVYPPDFTEDPYLCGQPAVARADALCRHGHAWTALVCAGCAEDAEHGRIFCITCEDATDTYCTGCPTLAVVDPLPGRG